jgi:hypothetical protein
MLGEPTKMATYGLKGMSCPICKEVLGPIGQLIQNFIDSFKAIHSHSKEISLIGESGD